MGLFLLSIFSLYVSLVIWLCLLACLAMVDTACAGSVAVKDKAVLIQGGICVLLELGRAWAHYLVPTGDQDDWGRTLSSR